MSPHEKTRQTLLKAAQPAALPTESDEDAVLSISLRPQRLDEFVGHREIVDNLRVAVQAAKQRGEPLEHVLLSGPPGLGKTSLSHIIAHEMDTKITATSGPAIERAGDLIGILTNLEKGDVLFIDEIHRLSKVVEEFLYPAMENFQIDFVIDKGQFARTIKFNLKPFTLVGATTRTGLLAAPLRSRFGIFHTLDFYKTEELASIIEHSAKLLGVAVEHAAALEIARRSRGTPRIANRLLRRVRDYAQVGKRPAIDEALAAQSLNDLGIDKAGFDDMDRRVMKVILDTYAGGPVGIEAIAASLNEETDSIADTVEPYLLKAGYLKRTPRGRVATRQAYEHLGKKYGRQDEMF